MQVIFRPLWDYWAHPGNFEIQITIKQALAEWGGGEEEGRRMQLRKLQCCIWRDSIKSSLLFLWIYVFFCFQRQSYLTFIILCLGSSVHKTLFLSLGDGVKEGGVVFKWFLSFQFISIFSIITLFFFFVVVFLYFFFYFFFFFFYFCFLCYSIFLIITLYLLSCLAPVFHHYAILTLSVYLHVFIITFSCLFCSSPFFSSSRYSYLFCLFPFFRYCVIL